MAWVKFVRLHWHRYTAQKKVRYPVGTVKNLPRAVAKKAIDDGNAIAMRKPSKTAVPEPADGKAS